MKIYKIAKLSWPIMKDKPTQNLGIWEQWMTKKISDSKFVDLMIHLIDLGLPGVTKDKNVRNGILSAIRRFKVTKDYKGTATDISAWLSAGKDVNEDMV